MGSRHSFLLVLLVICSGVLSSCQGGNDTQKKGADYGPSYANEVKEIWEGPKREAREVKDKLKKNDRRAQDTMKELDE